ncbi:MAG: type II secretion system major pseudopilin GspG [Verrucomicrobia bacterium]|jgi:general secretion pathway protein G|nr:type II secretion system major pseudopilin GspG [Verrucomicrobiota bacterium]MBT7066340.1 type II secretion system major pseudopilin GspG [Verrucomicrobiota bacterium]MBT7699732.1 type II secretion system major pseudopilin GspG [Verrucomicrobiota bacterium]
MKKSSTAGFTLLEILVVVLIITILSTLVGVNVISRSGEAKRDIARVQIETFKRALQGYRMDNGRYPTQRQGLGALCLPATTPPLPTKFPEGGYLESPVVPQDPWKQEFVYLVPGPVGYAYEIVSYGGDGEPDGEGEDADISSAAQL